MRCEPKVLDRGNITILGLCQLQAGVVPFTAIPSAVYTLGPEPLPLLEASLHLPVRYPAPCFSFCFHNILVHWSQPHKSVSFSHYDLTNTVSVLLDQPSFCTRKVFLSSAIHHSMHSAHTVTAVLVQTTSISLMKLIKRKTWYGEEYRRTSDLFHIYQLSTFQWNEETGTLAVLCVMR
jgi:hypothetical protein